VKDGITSLENPTSRSCRVEEVWPAYDVQDAGLVGVDHLHATISETVGEISKMANIRSMVPTRYEGFFVFLKKGVWRSCAAVGL
jgi:hypothetical protein